MNSSGLMTKWVVSSRHGVLSLRSNCPTALSYTRSSESAGHLTQQHRKHGVIACGPRLDRAYEALYGPERLPAKGAVAGAGAAIPLT